MERAPPFHLRSVQEVLEAGQSHTSLCKRRNDHRVVQEGEAKLVEEGEGREDPGRKTREGAGKER